jgi:hypothetical protein
MNWQPIETHCGRYEVSRSGQVRCGCRILKQWESDQGYMLVRLSGPRTVGRVHRLVAAAFVPNPNNLPYVNHIDCVRSNNEAENLEWCTQQYNLAHSERLGRMQRDYWCGKRSPNAMLSESDAASIREDYAKGGVSWATLSKNYGISKRSIGRIVNGESYV